MENKKRRQPNMTAAEIWQQICSGLSLTAEERQEGRAGRLLRFRTMAASLQQEEEEKEKVAL